MSFAASSALVAAIPRRRTSSTGAGQVPGPGPRASLRADIAEGLRWLFANRVLRAMAVLVAGTNLLSAGHGAILVLFAQERLGLGDVGFGLLLSGFAVGGLLGSVIAPWLSRRVGPARVMLGGFVAEGLVQLGVGLTGNPWVAGGLLTLSDLFIVVFNTIFGSLRQQLVPDRLLGRVISAFRLFSYGSVPLGALLGGVVARRFGLPAPFVVAGVLIPLMALSASPFVNRRTVEQVRAAVGQ